MTKRALLIITGIFLASLQSFAADDPPFMPMSPQIMGQGGSVEASAHGFDSFFSNPAGFSRSPGSVTAVSLESWMYSRPQGILDILGGAVGGAAGADRELFLGKESTSGGFGAGGSMGVGFAGSGLGLGVFLLFDSFLSGASITEASGDATATVAFVGGLSVPLKVQGMTVHVGGDVRPMIRVHTPIGSGRVPGLLSALAGQGNLFTTLSTLDALYGLGVALDLGAIAETGGLSFGLSVRDFGGTTFDYTRSTVGTVQNGLVSSLRFPAGTVPADTYTIPMSVNAGIALHPDMGNTKAAFDPVVHVDVQDIIGLATGARAPWTYIHAGVEAGIATLFTLRAGLSQGYFSAGVGLRLLFLDMNASLFTREMGSQQWESPSSGASLEIAVRF